MKETWEIRHMKEEDAVRVAALEAENFSDPWSLDAFQKIYFDKNYIVLILEKEEMILGYCVLLCAGTQADITNVCTAAQARRKGVATALLTALFEEGNARAVEEYFLEVREGNTAARTLYKKLGFEEIGTRKNYYEKPRENAVLMRRAQ